MVVKAILILLVAGATWAQLDQGILAQLYYPRPPAQHAQPPATSAEPLSLAQRSRRSYFDRDSDPDQGNDAALRRLRERMADPRWTPDIVPRTRWTD